jgi:hypothetical protein
VDVCRGCSQTDLRTHASLQLLEALHRRGLIWKQVEPRGRIFVELNPAIGEPVIEPMGRDPETPGELRDSQRPGHVARMRLMPLLHEAMLKPDGFDCTWQDMRPLRRAIALLRGLGRDRVVRMARRKEGQYLLFHGRSPLQVSEGPDGDWDRHGGRRPAFPHNTGLDLVPRGPMDDDFVNQTAEQRFALRLGQHVRLPQPRKRAPKVEEGGPQLGGQGGFCAHRRLDALGRGGFCHREGAEGRLPAPLQFGGDQPVVGIDPVELAFT